jgi:hypothetical protein
MSWDTNVILLCSGIESIDDIQQWLSHFLTDVNSVGADSTLVAGAVYMGRFDGHPRLDISGLLRVVGRVNWRLPDSVQLLVRDEYEEDYSMWTWSREGMREVYRWGKVGMA